MSSLAIFLRSTDMSTNRPSPPTISADGKPLDEGLQLLKNLSREQLIDIIIDDAKNWLAHDGPWFQAVDAAHGMEAAIDADREAWRSFTVIEAKRIMARLGLEPGGGMPRPTPLQVTS
jgi:hypothetical protein